LPDPVLSRAHHSPLASWHLLSLDAPTVAAVWTYFIAGCAGTALPWTSPAAMFVAVWMIYAADRLLDSRNPAEPGLEPRHRFHHQHRSRFLTAIVLGAAVLVWLLWQLNPNALKLYALLATLLAAWLLLVHARPAASSRRLPKELAVGICFSAAVFIPTVAREPMLRGTLLPAAALLAATCTLNCLFIYAWEHPAPRLQAHWTTRWATQHLLQLSTLLCVLALLASFFLHGRSVRLPGLACGVSAIMLMLLHKLRRHISPVHLRAAADAALLSPILLLPWLSSAL
jgi:hypothetical protein